MMEPRATMARPIQSCLQCRKRKIKCSRSIPCTPCQLRGEENRCREVDRNAEQTEHRPAETEGILERVQALEATVTKLSRIVARDSRFGSARSPDDTMYTVETPDALGASLAPPAIRSSFGTSNTSEEEVAMMLEDFAMGHRINTVRATQDAEDGPRARAVSRSGSPSSSDSLPGSQKHHSLLLLVDQSGDVVTHLVALLPTMEQSVVLVNFYFECLEWYSKVLHRPTFEKEAAMLRLQVETALIPSVRVSFLGVYCMVLCLAFHLIEPALARQLHIDAGESASLAQTMYSAAQACIHYDEFLGTHNLEHLQCIILMGVYQQNLDEADSHWALLGAAIKIAQNLGMSRLGSESDGRRYPPMWRSVVKREIARRIWWSLIFDDWSHAAAHHGTYSIHPAQNHTGHPANIDDADLVEGQPLRAKPDDQYTEMTSFLCRLRFVELYRHIVDHIQSPTGCGHAFIADVDARISRCVADLPACFQVNPAVSQASVGGVKALELTLCRIMGETRRLRLHRPFLFRGYRDRRYAKSREQCIISARAILQHLRSDVEQARTLLKWWLVLFYGFAAAVVLFVDLCHDGDGEHRNETRAELRSALELFKTASHTSTVSRNAMMLLEGLLNSEPNVPRRPPRKRKLSQTGLDHDDDPFEHIAKRIITDASKNMNKAVIETSDEVTLHQSASYDDIFPAAFSDPPPVEMLSSSDVFAAIELDDETMAELSELLCDNTFQSLWR